MSSVESQARQQLNLSIAMGEPLLHIKQLIPLLEYRHETSKRYFKYGKGTDEEKMYEDLIENINGKIRDVLGV